jgi:hypothetical protein
MTEKIINLTGEEYGKGPSSRHAFLELIEDVCFFAFGAANCSCPVIRKGIVWSELFKEV